jgi:L-arabinokinase
VNVLFYVTGHGFGHATRIAAIMEAMRIADPTVELSIRTHAAASLFRDIPGVQVYEENIDSGVVEENRYHQNEEATLKQYWETIHQRESDIVQREVNWIEKSKIDRIVFDIPPLAALIGMQASARGKTIPTIAVGNFTWSFVYKPYIVDGQYPGLLARINQCYAMTSLLLTIPLNEPMSAFPASVPRVEIPLLVRECTTTRQETRSKLGIAEERRPVVLLPLRDKEPPPDLQGLNEIAKDYLILSTHAINGADVWDLSSLPGQNWMGAHFPSIVAACDVVMAKLGYGIASECIANGIPLVYTPRNNFAEFAVLKEKMASVLPSVQIEKDDFQAGRWKHFLEHVTMMKRDRCWPMVRNEGPERFITAEDEKGPLQMRTDGAAIAAEWILGRRRILSAES